MVTPVLVDVVAESLGTNLGPGSNSVGLFNGGSAQVTARNSRFIGTNFGVHTESTATSNLVSSQLADGRATGGAYFCVDAYNLAFAVLDGSCDPVVP